MDIEHCSNVEVETTLSNVEVETTLHFHIATMLSRHLLIGLTISFYTVTYTSGSPNQEIYPVLVNIVSEYRCTALEGIESTIYTFFYIHL